VTTVSLIDRVSALLAQVVAEEVEGRFRQLAAHEIEAKPTMWDPDDLVTVVDRRVEERLEQGLAALLPGSTVIGEEAVHARPELLQGLTQAGPVWLIDPIDGTRNFARGDDRFGVMVALLDAGATRAAWITLPARGQTFVAEAGAGAYLDGHRLFVRQPATPPRGTLYTGYMPPDQAATVIAASRGHYTEQTADSAAAIEYTSIVLGGKDLVVYYRLLPWDHAPGALLLTEAGGSVEHLDGRPYMPRDRNEVTILAAQPAVAAAVRGWLGSAAD
jgi:fructose-1,6-bisphosphatase/inositol monophosphatase family enzyme